MTDLTDALYRPLLLGHTVGRVISPFPIGAGALAARLVDTTRPAVLAGTADVSDALRERISYLDRRSLVVLGDPAVALPSLAAAADRPRPAQP